VEGEAELEGLQVRAQRVHAGLGVDLGGDQAVAAGAVPAGTTTSGWRPESSPCGPVVTAGARRSSTAASSGAGIGTAPPAVSVESPERATKGCRMRPPGVSQTIVR